MDPGQRGNVDVLIGHFEAELPQTGLEESGACMVMLGEGVDDLVVARIVRQPVEVGGGKSNKRSGQQPRQGKGWKASTYSG